jgi:hypothetical protein
LFDFGRGKNWRNIYDLAENQTIKWDKGVFDYFNYSLKNPLYAKHDFSITKILKRQDNEIIPNIKIQITTQKKITQQLNPA